MSDNQNILSSDFNSNRQVVYCKKCSVGNVLYEEFIRWSSLLGRYITCSECENDIALDVNCIESKVTEPSAVSQSVSLDNETGTSKGIRPKCQFRILKNSGSLPEELERKPVEDEVPPETKMEMSIESVDIGCKGQWGDAQQPPSPGDHAFGDSVPLISTLTDKDLRDLLAMIRNHPCIHCGCSNCDLLVPVAGDSNVKFCHNCERVSGVDDSMNYYDYQKFIDNCRVTACTSCGNDDPEKFVFVKDEGDGKGQSTLAIKCIMCESLPQQQQQQQHQQEVKIYCSCEKCKNMDVTKFEISSDANDILKSVCKVCNNTKIVNVGSVSGLECQCSTANAQYQFDEFGYIVLVKCEGCGSSMPMNDVSPEAKLPNDGSSRGRTKVISLDMIGRGDHIAWHQSLGYWHHAVVVEVQFYMVQVIHYNGPAAHKGQIVEQWLMIDPKKEQLYRIDYDPKFRNPPEIVVQRAISRVGEHSYNLFTNNCEHFARWCVTGKHCSFQVQSFYKTLAQRFAWSLQGRSAQHLVKLGFTVDKPPSRLTARVMDKVFSYFARSGSKMASSEMNSVAAGSVAARPVATGLVVAYEVISATRDIRAAYQQRKEGVINRDEFLRVTIKRTCEGVGSLAGTAITLTIPVANSVVGLTLGAVIGKGIGGLVGRNIARVVR